MSEENPKTNKRPKEASANLPMAVLIILVGIVCLLLFIFWKYLSDEPSTIQDLQVTTEQPLVQEEETPEEPEVMEDNVVTDESLATIQTPEQKPASVSQPDEKREVIPADGTVHTHVVQAEQTFFSIATQYNLALTTLQKQNPDVNPNAIKVGITQLKVPVLAIHTVGPGDILKVVSAKYNVSVEKIMLANNKKQNFAERGEKLVIPYPTRR
ncbi:MAG: LysM peptidoglycan-binding domain-containing protein [Spirosomataceae bacterium]